MFPKISTLIVGSFFLLLEQNVCQSQPMDDRLILEDTGHHDKKPGAYLLSV